MKILCVGDVAGQPGVDFLCSELPRLKHENAVDFVIVNAENADASGTGLSRAVSEILLQYTDIITTGNHCFRRADKTLFADCHTVLHPANFPFSDPGAGCVLLDTGRFGTLRVINLVGTAFMEPVDNPFQRADELLKADTARFTIVDFHAESTAEKKALAYYLDGRVSAVFGTHTHVQTADEQILPGGTGYITDVGMTGPVHSVLGVDPALAVEKQRTHRPVRFRVADGPVMLNAVLFTLDDTSGLCTGVKRIDWRGSTPP